MSSPSDEDPSSQSFTLSHGRKIGFKYFGAETGPTVFYLHEFPASRLSGVLLDGPAKEQGARIISVERPGVGISSPQPGRKILDHVSDIRELAEHLKVETYGVIGFSGGGPYALGCAYALPEENLKGVSVVGGVGSMDMGNGTKDMRLPNWLLFNGLMHVPFVVRLLHSGAVSVLRNLSNKTIVSAVTRVPGRSSKGPSRSNTDRPSPETAEAPGPSTTDTPDPNDPEFLNMMVDFNREHFRQGVDGFMEEGRVLTSDWGFRLEDIRPSIPIQLWYSKKDTNVPISMGEDIAARLGPGRDLHVLEDETHMELVLKHASDALEQLLDKM